jgi:hypothetical protein
VSNFGIYLMTTSSSAEAIMEVKQEKRSGSERRQYLLAALPRNLDRRQTGERRNAEAAKKADIESSQWLLD